MICDPNTGTIIYVDPTLKEIELLLTHFPANNGRYIVAQRRLYFFDSWKLRHPDVIHLLNLSDTISYGLLDQKWIDNLLEMPDLKKYDPGQVDDFIAMLDASGLSTRREIGKVF